MFLLSAKGRILHYYISFPIKEAEIMGDKLGLANFILFLYGFVILPADKHHFWIFVNEDDFSGPQQKQAYAQYARTTASINNYFSCHFSFKSHVPGPFCSDIT